MCIKISHHTFNMLLVVKLIVRYRLRYWCDRAILCTMLRRVLTTHWTRLKCSQLQGVNAHKSILGVAS